MLLKEQNFGVEIELTGITRCEAARIIAKYFGKQHRLKGGYYDVWEAPDKKGRIWKAMYDGSIFTQKKVNGTKVRASSKYSCEVVTPILQYDDMDDLQEIIRLLAKKGAFANPSTGVHVHVDGAKHNMDSLQRVLNFAVGRQELFYEALGISEDRKSRWCKCIDKKLFTEIKKCVKTKSAVERILYSSANDNYAGGIDHGHYNSTRYHGVNLHAFFSKGTVEFRLFNGTTHAGKIKAYVQFCLAISAWAIETENINLHFKPCTNYSKAQKKALMLRVLKGRLGMTGKEFKTARLHLTAAFDEIAEEVA